MLFHSFKMRVKDKIVRCKSGLTEYVIYDIDRALVSNSPKAILSSKLDLVQDAFKKLVFLENMTMQFPLNHKYAITSDNRLFVIGGTFNLYNSYRQTYEIVNEDTIVDRGSMIEPRNSFGCLAIETSVLVIGGYHSLKRTLSTCELYSSVHDKIGRAHV